MEKNLRIAHAVNEKLSKCGGGCQSCTCQKLRHYMEETGIEEFVRRLEAGELPSDIQQLYEKKAHQVS